MAKHLAARSELHIWMVLTATGKLVQQRAGGSEEQGVFSLACLGVSLSTHGGVLFLMGESFKKWSLSVGGLFYHLILLLV